MVFGMVRVRLKCLFVVAVAASCVVFAGVGTHLWHATSDHVLSSESESESDSEGLVKLHLPEDELRRAMYDPVHFHQVKELQEVGGAEGVNANRVPGSDEKLAHILLEGHDVSRTGNVSSTTHSDVKEFVNSLFDAETNLNPRADIAGIQNEPKEEMTAAKENAPIHVVIFTKRRSGSSFLGQIFNHNTDVFFHFEPLKLLEYYMDYKELQNQASETLSNIFKCKLKGTRRLIDFYNKEGLHRSSSKVLSSPPFCQQPKVDRHSVKRCPKITPKVFLDWCHQKRHIAVKIIRVVDIRSLAAVMSDPTLNVKLVHLVRDPRAVYNSRVQSEKLEYSFDDQQRVNMINFCQGMRDSHEASRNLQWLSDSGKYFLVRYEDLAESPLPVARELYGNLGLGELPESVRQWIEANSNVNPTKSDGYSTQRNSSAIFQAWRSKLPFAVAQKIEDLESCGAVLDHFGYQRARSEKELTDMSHSLLNQIPKLSNDHDDKKNLLK